MIEITLSGLLEFVQIYIEIGIGFLFLISFIAGYNDREINGNDVKESAMWPFFLMNELGAGLKALLESRKGKKK